VHMCTHTQKTNKHSFQDTDKILKHT